MKAMSLPNLSRHKRRPTAPSYIVISGEHVTIPEAAKRLGMTEVQFSGRRRHVLARLAPGEVLTWEALIPAEGMPHERRRGRPCRAQS